MAIITHMTSKNAHYSDAYYYYRYKQKRDEETGEYDPLLDEYGLLQERENCAITYLTPTGQESDPELWALSCVRTNMAFGKNQGYNDRKNHEYIISHPEEDRPNMTMEDLLEEGKAFVRENLQGYDALIAVHRDTDNDHIHITINSVRAIQRNAQPWMLHDEEGNPLPCEYIAGGKHQDSPEFRRHYNDWLMEYTRSHGWVVQDNNAIADERKRSKGIDQDRLERVLWMAAASSHSVHEMQQILNATEGITLTVRGNTWSILSPDRKNPIRLDTLGIDPAQIQEAFQKQPYPAPAAPDPAEPADVVEIDPFPEEPPMVFPSSPGTWWTDGYKQARNLLYGTKDIPAQPEQAYALLQQEAAAGNGFAVHDLGKLHMQGLGCQQDDAKAHRYFQAAMQMFREKEPTERKNGYMQYRIGKLYALGWGVKQDYEEAAGWFQSAVHSEQNAPAAYALANQYLRGQGVPRSEEQAYRLFKIAADSPAGNPFASYELWRMNQKGIGTPVDPAEAQRRAKQAVQGFEKSVDTSPDDRIFYRLGTMYESGTGTEKDIDTARRYYEKSAALKNGDAMCALGKLYLQKEYSFYDPTTAISYLEQAIDAGNRTAAFRLATMYHKGVDVPRDFEKSLLYYRQAAEDPVAPNAYAAYELGRMYEKGEGISPDPAEAAKWYATAYQGFCQLEENGRGDDRLYYRMAMMNLHGVGTPEDVRKAATYFEKAVEGGNTFAAYTLASMYRQGNGVAPDDRRALQLYLMAANNPTGSNAYAAYELGRMYREGIGTAPDPAESERWYATAYRRFCAIEAAGEAVDDRLYTRMARMLQEGLGVKQDARAAAAYLEKAIEAGSSGAMFTFAGIYLNRTGGSYDPAKAEQLLHRASEEGSVYAQYRLAHLYIRGDHLPQDLEKGIRLLEALPHQSRENIRSELEDELRVIQTQRRKEGEISTRYQTSADGRKYNEKQQQLADQYLDRWHDSLMREKALQKKLKALRKEERMAAKEKQRQPQPEEKKQRRFGRSL